MLIVAPLGATAMDGELDNSTPDETPQKAGRPHVGLPEGMRAAEAARFVGISPSLWRSLDARGLVPAPVELSIRLPIWPRTELRAWLLAGAPPRIKWRQIREAAIARYQAQANEA